MLANTLFLLPVVLPVVLATNDWSVPCFGGTCEYDSGDGIKAAWGSMALTGPVNAISDVTKAAGWHILDCDPNDKQGQTIRMVCVGDDTEEGGCGHLDQGGAEHTIIRLPESCGGGPFARVDSKWIHEDQFIPAAVRKMIKRDDPPPVQAVQFDFDFSKIPPGNGPIALSASATNIPGNEQTLGSRALKDSFRKSRRSVGDRRPLFRRNFITDIINKLKKLNKFDKTFRDTLPPLNVAKNFPIFEQSIDCPAVGAIPALSAKVNMNVDTDLHATVTFGYVVQGTIVPPHIDDLAIYSSLNADASATFNIDAAAKASIDSGVKDLFSVGLPGLDFPGIFTLGPSFAIGGQIKATLGATGNMKIGAKFTMPQVELVFPPNQGDSVGGGDALETPLKLSFNPSGEAFGSVEAHIIPRVDLGAKILGGIASATVFLAMDVAGNLGMNVKGQAGITNEADPNKSASGCVDMGINMDINAGAHGSLKPFFDESVSKNLFSKKFNLLHKCFGGATRRDISPLPTLNTFAKRDLTCSGIDSALTTFVDELIKPF